VNVVAVLRTDSPRAPDNDGSAATSPADVAPA
jgi:hypothetical protein